MKNDCDNIPERTSNKPLRHACYVYGLVLKVDKEVKTPKSGPKKGGQSGKKGWTNW